MSDDAVQNHRLDTIERRLDKHDEMLAKFFAELNKLAEIAEFTVIPFDTRVEEDPSE